MYVNKCIKCGSEFETKNPKRVICPNCLYPDKSMMPGNSDSGNGENHQHQQQDGYNQQNEPQNNYNSENYGGGYSSGGGYSAGGYSSGGYSAGGYDRPQRSNYNQGGYQQRNNYNQDRGQRNYQQRDYRSQGGYSSGGGYSAGGYSSGGYSTGGYDRPQRSNYNQGGYQQRNSYNQNRSQGNYQQRSSYNQNRPQQNGYKSQQRRPGGFQQRRPSGRPQRPQQPKQLLITPEQVAQIEVLYKSMLPLPNPDAHEVIGEKIGLEPKKVFFGINLVRQKMKLPKLPFPKRKLAISPDQLLAIKSLYEPLLPLPPIGCHKIIAVQLKMDEWRVHVGIGLLRKQMGLDRWNQDREDAPEEFKTPKADEKPTKTKKTAKSKSDTETVEEEPKVEKKTRGRKPKKADDEE